MKREFVELETRIAKEVKDPKVVRLLTKVLEWELQRVDMYKPMGAVDDFQYFINEEIGKDEDN